MQSRQEISYLQCDRVEQGWPRPEFIECYCVRRFRLREKSPLSPDKRDRITHTKMPPQFDLANGFHSGVCAVSRYMRESAKPMLHGVLNPSFQEQSIEALFLRALCWMTTIEKLNAPGDFQAVAACTRGLLEATIDIIFLCNDPKGEAPQKMLDWATSSKFKACKQVIAFYSKRSQPIPDEHQPMLDFYTRHSPLMPSLQAKHGWVKNLPDRWTSRSLPGDCVVADGLEGSAIRDEMKMTLSEFYETQVRRLNWNIHSSGVAAVYGISYDTICALCALAFKSSADLAMLTTMLALRNVGFPGVSPQITSDWENLKATRLVAFKAGLIKAVSDETV